MFSSYSFQATAIIQHSIVQRTHVETVQFCMNLNFCTFILPVQLSVPFSITENPGYRSLANTHIKLSMWNSNTEVPWLLIWYSKSNISVSFSVSKTGYAVA
jgi:hypothetical protein